MSYQPIAKTLPQYENYPNWWIKAYEQGTTTPKNMGDDSTPTTTYAKLELDLQGFPNTSGGARLIPWIDDAYDLWLFPTEAEANANDTTNAIQLADNIGDPSDLPANQNVTLNEDTTTTMAANTAKTYAVGDTVMTKEFSAGDGGSGIYDVVLTSSVTPNGFNIIQGTSDTTISFVLRETNPLNINTYGPTEAGIQAALNSGKKQIYGESGFSHALTGTLTVPADVFLDFRGVTFTAATHFKMFLFTSGGGIKGATLTGAGDSSLTIGSWGIGCEGTNNNPAAPTFVNAPVIEDCVITDFGEYGIRFSYVNGGEVRGNTIKDVGYAGVGGISCNDTIVSGNKISDIDQGSSGDAYGVFIDRANGVSETENPRSYRCVISNNIIENIQVGSNGQGVDTHAGIDFVIDSNVIKDCDSGIRLAVSVISGVPQLGCKRCIVSNNTIHRPLSSSVNTGIGVTGAQVGGTVNDYAEDNIICNNALVGYGLEAVNTSGGITIQATKNTVITGNVIKNSNSNGMYVNIENVNLNITGNTFVDPWDDTVTAPACIKIDANNVTGRIADNNFVFDDASVGTNVAVNAIRISGSLTGLDLELKDCSFIGIDATHLNNSIGTTAGVNQTGLFRSSGTATLAVTSGNSQDSVAVSFSKRFPYIPEDIQLTLRHSFNGGGDFPIIGVTNTAPAISQTGFTIYANPADGGTWSSTGNLTIYWRAE